jgi:hypothetical protein
MQFEMLCQDLARGAEIVRALTTGLTEEEARFKPDPESWSVLEVVCHLYDEEREDFCQRLDIMLHRPAEKWPPIDPMGWVTARRYNERDVSESLAGFLAERERSLAWLEGLSAPNWEAEYAAPFGPLRAGDMLASWVAHDTLHIRQLVELQRGRNQRLAAPFGLRYAGEW